jgi:hypothetical protein
MVIKVLENRFVNLMPIQIGRAEDNRQLIYVRCQTGRFTYLFCLVRGRQFLERDFDQRTSPAMGEFASRGHRIGDFFAFFKRPCKAIAPQRRMPNSQTIQLFWVVIIGGYRGLENYSCRHQPSL